MAEEGLMMEQETVELEGAPHSGVREKEKWTGPWPVGVPKDYKELFAKGSDWEKFIQGRLRAYNKVGRNFADLYQDMVIKLISSQVLEKFVKKAMTRLPATMSAQEMCDYVGIPFKKLEYLQWRFRLTAEDRTAKNVRLGQTPFFMPTPIEGTGGVYSRKARYLRAEVIEFNQNLEAGVKCRRNDGKHVQKRLNKEGKVIEVGVAVERVTEFAPTGDGFKTYIGQAIHNHFANFCRTKARKEQEHLLSPNSVVSNSGQGSYRVSASFEEGSAWEATLSDTLSHPDEIEARLDFAHQFRDACAEAGLSLEAISDYISGLESEGAGPTQKASALVDLFDHMAKTGKDLPDAFAKIHGVTLSKNLTRRIRGTSTLRRTLQ